MPASALTQTPARNLEPGGMLVGERSLVIEGKPAIGVASARDLYEAVVTVLHAVACDGVLVAGLDEVVK